MLPTAPGIAPLGTYRRQLPTHEDIVRLQSTMLPIQSEQPEPQHIFHDGWYERRLLVPAGMLVVGKIQRHAHFFGVIRGHAWLISAFGQHEVRGGFAKTSRPGIKHIAAAIEDTLFVTLHRNPSNTRDLAQIEAEHIVAEALVFDAPETLQ